MPIRTLRSSAWLLCVCALPAWAASLKEDGDKAFEAGDFTRAAACYAGALKEKPALAQDEDYRVKSVRAKAGASCEAAQRLMAGGHGLGALEEVRAAAQAAPGWEVPALLLPKAMRAAADEHVARGQRKLAQADLAGAEQEAAAALALAADLAKAGDLRDAVVKQRAEARQAAAASADAMAAGEWEKAEALSRLALDLDATPKELKARLGEIFLRRADAQVKAGQTGAAFLGCRRGASLAPEAKERAAVLLAQLRREEMPRFRWKIEGPQDLLVAKWLAARGLSAEGGAKAQGPLREVKVEIKALEAKVARVSSEVVTTPWYEERQELNPEFDAIELKLAKAEEMRMAARLRQEGVKGGDALRAAAEAETWETAVRELAAERNATPRARVTRIEHTQAHTREEWKASGRLQLRFVAAGDEPVAAEDSFEKHDVIRVGDKKPDLPDEASILEGMGKKALDQALPVLLEPAILARVARLRHDAAKAEAAGDKAAALEGRVRAAVLLGVVSPALGEKGLKELE